MGFYAPAQIVRDAREHGVEVRPVCVNASYWDNVLEPDGRGGLALRLGFRQIKGLSEDEAGWIAAARGNGYRDVAAVWRRAGTSRRLIEQLVEADAFASPRPHAGARRSGRRGRSTTGAAAAFRRDRGPGRGGGGRAAADDARRGDRRRLYGAAPDAQGAPDGADPAAARRGLRATAPPMTE